MSNLLKKIKNRLRLAGWDGIRPAIVVLGGAQRLQLLGRYDRHGQPLPNPKRRRWLISTGQAGFGCQLDSGRTPTGMHRIAEMFGAEAPLGMVFKSRKATGEIVQSGRVMEGDYITSRILWLEGLEPGHNQGPGVDSLARFIYIHGTPHTDHLGTPASAGCVRMRDTHVARLFRRVGPGTLVYIVPPVVMPVGKK
ncbi:MAG: L,D-transpeptidase [Magnetococcales bacterium]|nr:L,D-transpeptidase [Magnetococcales bacterium]